LAPRGSVLRMVSLTWSATKRLPLCPRHAGGTVELSRRIGAVGKARAVSRIFHKLSGFSRLATGSEENRADGTNTAAQFDSPAGVAVDTNGQISSVADQVNDTIRKLTPLGANSGDHHHRRPGQSTRLVQCAPDQTPCFYLSVQFDRWTGRAASLWPTPDN